jgi:hypothetical protein
MAKKKIVRKPPKKKLTEIGETAPANFKFALIVAVMVIWLQFLRSFFSTTIQRYFPYMWTGIWTWPAIRDFVVAAGVTVAAFLILVFYRKIRNRVAKVKVPV